MRPLKPKPMTDFFPVRKSESSHGAGDAAGSGAKDAPLLTPAPASPTKSEAVDARRFHAVCDVLSLDDQTRKLANDLLHRFSHSELGRSTLSVAKVEASMMLAAIWVAGRVGPQLAAGSSMPRYNGITLTQLIKETDCNLSTQEAFSYIKTFLTNANYDSILTKERVESLLQTDLVQMERACESLTLVFRKFKDSHALLFSRQHVGSRDLMSFAWCLFLNAKETLLERSTSYSFNEFILCQCALLFTYQMAEPEQVVHINSVLSQLRADMPTASIPKEASDMFALRVYLCEMNSVDLTTFRDAELSRFVPFVQQLLRQDPRAMRSLRYDYTAPMSDGVVQLPHVHRLLDASSGNLRLNLNDLSARYEERIRTFSGEIDARFFVEEHISLMTPRKSGGWRTPGIGKLPAARNLAKAFDDGSYVTSPISARTMVGPRVSSGDEVAVLRQALSDMDALCSAEPSPFLIDLMHSAGPDTMINTLQQLEHALVLIPRDVKQSMPHYERYLTMLFYRTLDLVCKRESARLTDKQPVFNLLRNNKFHRSMLICCFQIVGLALLPAQRQVRFLDTLHHMGLKAFDLVINIETFIRENVQQLSRAGIKRLKEMEERLLETEVWKDDDPLYTLMEAEAEAQARTGATRRPLASLTDAVPAAPVRRSAAPTTSSAPPMGAAQRAVSAISSTTGMPRVAFLEDNTWASNQLQLFYRKLLLLLHMRLASLCRELNVPAEKEKRMWDMIVVLVQREDRFRLFRQRHIDQAMMCAMYVVSKLMNGEHVEGSTAAVAAAAAVGSPDVTGSSPPMQPRSANEPLLFRDIIKTYMTQPQYRKATVCEVIGGDGAPCDIIAFYNTVFVVSAGALLRDFKTVPPSPRPAVQPLPLASSPLAQRIVLQQNISLSPMHPDRAQQLQQMSPTFLQTGLTSPSNGSMLKTAAIRAAIESERAALYGPSFSRAYVFGEYSGEGVKEGGEAPPAPAAVGRESKRRLDFDNLGSEEDDEEMEMVVKSRRTAADGAGPSSSANDRSRSQSPSEDEMEN